MNQINFILEEFRQRYYGMLLKTYLSTAAQVCSGSSFWQTGAETNKKGLATRRATAILWCFVRHFTNWVSTWRTVTTSHQFTTEGWFRRPDSARWGSPRKIGHLIPSVARYAAGFCVQLQNHSGISDKRDLMIRRLQYLSNRCPNAAAQGDVSLRFLRFLCPTPCIHVLPHMQKSPRPPKLSKVKRTKT